MKQTKKSVAMFFIAILFLAIGCQKVELPQQKVAVEKKENPSLIENQKEFVCPVLEDAGRTAQAMVTFRKSNNSNSATSVEKIYMLDFNGEYLAGTIWNTNGPYNFPAAGYSASQMDQVVNAVQNILKPWNVKVTRSQTIFNSALVADRSKCIMTPNSSYFGTNWNGIAYISSFYWADGTPDFVFTANFGGNLFQVARAAAHEYLHMLGGYHQSKWSSNCLLEFEYHPMEGYGEFGWCPLLGNPWQGTVVTLHKGTPSTGCTDFQDDLAIADAALGRRLDDFSNEISGATLVGTTAKSFVTENHNDVDVFKTTGGKPWITLLSNNLDYAIDVYRNGVFSQTIDPSETRSINCRINTTGPNSTIYQLKVRVSGNVGNMPRNDIATGTGSIKVSSSQ